MNAKEITNLELSVILGIDVPHYFDRYQKGWSNESEIRGVIGYVFRHYVPGKLLEKMNLTIDQAVDGIWKSFANGYLLRLRDAVYEEMDHYYDTLLPDEEEPYLKSFREVAKKVAVCVGRDSLEARCEQVQKRLEQHLESTGNKLPPEDFVRNIAESLKSAVGKVEAMGEEMDYQVVEEDIFDGIEEEILCH